MVLYLCMRAAGALAQDDAFFFVPEALAAFGWDRTQADIKRRRAAGELVGAGIAIFMEESGRGPADNAKVKVDLTYQEVRRGDVLVLCSDGLSGQVKKDEIAKIRAEEQRRQVDDAPREGEYRP